MPARFWKSVKKAFSQALPREVPPFGLPATQPPKARGLLFTARADSNLHFFIYFSPDKYWERFTIEVGWNCGEAYPFDRMPDSVFDETGAYRKDMLKADRYRARIRTLAGVRELWYGPPPQSAAEMLRDFENILAPRQRDATEGAPDPKFVANVVSDALDRISTAAIPLFDAVAKARRCGDWKRTGRG